MMEAGATVGGCQLEQFASATRSSGVAMVDALADVLLTRLMERLAAAGVPSPSPLAAAAPSPLAAATPSPASTVAAMPQPPPKLSKPPTRRTDALAKALPKVHPIMLVKKMPAKKPSPPQRVIVVKRMMALPPPKVVPSPPKPCPPSYPPPNFFRGKASVL